MKLSIIFFLLLSSSCLFAQYGEPPVERPYSYTLVDGGKLASNSDLSAYIATVKKGSTNSQTFLRIGWIYSLNGQAIATNVQRGTIYLTKAEAQALLEKLSALHKISMLEKPEVVTMHRDKVNEDLLVGLNHVPGNPVFLLLINRLGEWTQHEIKTDEVANCLQTLKRAIAQM